MLDKELVELVENGSLVPHNNMVIVKRDGAEKREADEYGLVISGSSKGGILLPGTAYAKEDWCTVMAVPAQLTDKDGSKRAPALKKGDRVFVKPEDCQKEIPSHPEYQWCRYERIEAIEVDGQIQPFEKRVLAEKIEEELKSEGGIILPDTSSFTARTKKIARTGRARVMSLGPNFREEVQISQEIRLDRNDGREIDVNGVECLVIEEKDIMGVIEETSYADMRFYEISLNADGSISDNLGNEYKLQESTMEHIE